MRSHKEHLVVTWQIYQTTKEARNEYLGDKPRQNIV